jgi:DNA primase
MLEARTALLCEGQIDAIRCHEAGVLNTVASQGTALTPAHARLLRRHADEVVIVLDADAAGEAAAVRSAEAFLEAGLTVRIAALPPGEDPDSLILKQGADAFRDVISKAQSVIRFQVERFEKKGELATEPGRQRAAKALLEIVSHADEEVQKEAMLKEAARELSILPTALRAGLARVRTPYSLGRSTEVEEKPAPKVAYPPDEISLLDLLVHHPEVTPLVRAHLPASHFTDAHCRQIAEVLLTPDTTGPDHLLEALSNLDAGEACAQLAIRLQTDPSKVRGVEFSTEDAARDTLLRLWRKHFEAERRRVQQAIRHAEGDERKRLLLESKQLTEDISRMRQGWELAQPILELSMPAAAPES